MPYPLEWYPTVFFVILFPGHEERSENFKLFLNQQVLVSYKLEE